jgi:hypothetical protein
MPPRTTQKSHRPRAQIESWLPLGIRIACCVSEIDRWTPFPLGAILAERSSPSRVRSAAPIGAPWTAPGRSTNTSQQEEKAGTESILSARTNLRWSANARPMDLSGWEDTDARRPQSAQGLNARNSGPAFSSVGEILLLTLPFIGRRHRRSLPGESESRRGGNGRLGLRPNGRQRPSAVGFGCTSSFEANSRGRGPRFPWSWSALLQARPTLRGGKP